MDNSGGMKRIERRDVARPPRLRTAPALPRGPRLYKTPKNLGYKGPVMEPPAGFVRGTTSVTEWAVYFGLAKVTGTPENYREPPFIGSPGTWAYQKAWDEGRRAPGGSVIDFVLFAGAWSDQDIAIRVMTERFHLYADFEQQSHDALQLNRLSGFMRVVDIYDNDFLWDPTGQAIVVLIKDALAGSTYPNPINQGSTQRATRMRLIST
jgi:hypothetical protein